MSSTACSCVSDGIVLIDIINPVEGTMSERNDSASPGVQTEVYGAGGDGSLRTLSRVIDDLVDLDSELSVNRPHIVRAGQH